MGYLAHQKNFILMLLVSLWISSCAIMTAASVVPGALIEVVADQFTGQEKSFATNMKTTLAATQLSLRSMKLDVDILEIQPAGGYAIAFGNANLDGSISLKKQAARLTTIYVKARGTTREESVERAVIESIGTQIKSMPHNGAFQHRGYHNLRKKPTTSSARVGWFRPGARMEAHKVGKSNWLRIKLPSGKMAYLKGSIKGEII